MNHAKTFIVGKEHLQANELPVITVAGATLPEAWEAAVLAVWEHGCAIRTEYDQDIDPDSRAASTVIVIANPLAEPRIHKSLPVGLDELHVYMREVVDGAHDSRIHDAGWSYSYHDRLANWPGLDGWNSLQKLTDTSLFPHVDQLDTLARKLAQTPYSRRAQAITWNPLADAEHHEPPCLQRIWCQVVKSGDGYLLEMNTHWRSRDLFKAALMNIFAIADLQKRLAERISALSGLPVGVGRMMDCADNAHIYGSYVRRGEIDGFVKAISMRSFAERTLRSDDPQVQDEFRLGAERLAAEAK